MATNYPCARSMHWAGSFSRRATPLDNLADAYLCDWSSYVLVHTKLSAAAQCISPPKLQHFAFVGRKIIYIFLLT